MRTNFIISKSRTALFVILLFAFLFGTRKGAFAQWEPIGKFDSLTTCIYSIDHDSVVFVGTQSNLWRSSDYGANWNPVGIPCVSSIQFKDNLHGWLTQLASLLGFSGITAAPNCVLRTSDGGITWTSIYPDTGLPTSIIYQPSSHNLFLIQWEHFPSAVSTNDGNTWQNIAPYNFNRCGMTFTNDHHGIITMSNAFASNADSVFVTDDDGQTWTEALMGQETWQPVGIPGTDSVLAFGECPFCGGNWPSAWIVNRSTDGGYTWEQPNIEPNFSTTGTSLWCDCGSVIMTQSTYDWDSTTPARGIVYSTDFGDTWNSFGGPTHWSADTRFFYSGQYIYAGDSSSNPTTVWRYAVHHYPTITYPDQFQACSAVDTSFHISFTNTCFGIPASLDSFALTGSPAFSLQPITTPFALANEQDIGLHYAPTPGSHDTAYLYLKFNQHGDIKDTTLTFIGSGPEPESVSLHLAASATNAFPGSTFSLNVYSNAAITDVGLDTISFTLNYWNDLLTLVNPPAPITVQNGEASVPITIIGNNLTLNPATPITKLTFEAMLTDTLHTTLSITSPVANPSDNNYATCVLSLTSDSTPFTLDLACGDTTILTAMQNQLPFYIKSIQPNPAQDEIAVTLSESVNPEIEMYDALGRAQDVRSTSLPSVIALDVTNVPSGIYFIRVSAGGYVESRSVVIAH
jgi:photosystem II stability/assembly factor-like uncharacterized protein